MPISSGRTNWEMERQQAIRTTRSGPAVECPAKGESVPSSQPNRGAASVAEDRRICTDLPTTLPVSLEEVALLRAYLAQEIDRILFGED